MPTFLHFTFTRTKEDRLFAPKLKKFFPTRVFLSASFSPPRQFITYIFPTETFPRHETVKPPFRRQWRDYDNRRPLQSSTDDLLPTTFFR